MKNLLKRAQLGDDEAFSQLFQEHAKKLWNIAVSVMHSEDLAADMLQETVIKAWRAIPKFDEASKLSTWLTRILLNTCFDELRNQKKLIPFAEISDIAAHSARLAHGGSHEPSNAQGDWSCGQSDAIDTRLDIDAVMSQLSADDRAVLTLFYMDDVSTSDIAAILGISDGAVRTRLSRARTHFKNIYTNSGHMDLESVAQNATEKMTRIAK